MKCKYFILYLLVVCLLVSVISPGVLAAGNVDAPVSAPAKDLRVQPAELQTLKTQAPAAQEEHWTVAPVQSASSHANAALTASLQELKEASEIYAQNDVVAAFIVLEDAPLVEQGYDAIRSVPAAQTNQLLQKQDSVIRTIEKNVLDGSKLDVRYQFTYLTNSVSVRVEFGRLAEIAAQPGVKTVFLAPTYAPQTDVTMGQNPASPMSSGSAVSSGAQEAWAQWIHRRRYENRCDRHRPGSGSPLLCCSAPEPLPHRGSAGGDPAPAPCL